MIMRDLYNLRKISIYGKGKKIEKLIQSYVALIEVEILSTEVIIWILTTLAIMSSTQGSEAHVKRKVDRLLIGQRHLEIRVSWKNRRRADSGPAWGLSAYGYGVCMGRTEWLSLVWHRAQRTLLPPP